MQGAELFCEAMGNMSALGRYRELIRVFELAFRRDSYGMGRKLVQFLDPDLGFTRVEVDGWLAWRDAANHTDLAKSPKLAFERDVQPFVERMQQAGLDVLLNKAIWADASRIRRNAYSAKIAKLSPAGDLRFTQGATGSIAIDFPLDCFNAWPVRQRGIFRPERGWWAPGSGIAE